MVSLSNGKKRLKFSAVALVILGVVGLTVACAAEEETKCVDGAAACGSGKIQSCAVGEDGKCTRGYYKAPDGKQFAWASCDNTTQAALDYVAYCQGLGGGADASTD